MLKLVPILLIFFAPCIVWADDSGEINYVGTYHDLRSKALVGSAGDKFDAFVYVYENTSELREYVPEAFEFLVESAEGGFVHAQYDLGFLYAIGRWVEQDDDKALPWLIKAANNGSRRAHLWAGMAYLSKYNDASEPEVEADYLGQIEYWLRALIREEGEESRLTYAAKEVLARALLSDSVANREAWGLLRDLKEVAYEPGLNTISVTEQIFVEQHAEGHEDAGELLQEFRQFMSETD